MADLEARLTQEHHHREDLEVKVLALEKDHKLLEVENKSLVEQCSRGNDLQKGMSLNLALFIISVVRCLPVMCSPGDGPCPFSGSCRPAP